MSLRLSRPSSLLFTGLLSPVLALLTLCLPAGAQLSPSWEVSLTFPKTQDRGAPKRTTGGSARNESCIAEEPLKLTAFTPKNNVLTTVSSNPNLLVYVPPTTAQTAEILLLDHETEEEIYITNIILPATQGIMQVSLPETVNLEVGKLYRWGLSVICDEEQMGGSEYVSGLIERTELTPEVESQLAQATSSLEKATIYAEAGIWNEAVMLLAPLRQFHPQEWQEVLQSVELQPMANEPFHFSSSFSQQQNPLSTPVTAFPASNEYTN